MEQKVVQLSVADQAGKFSSATEALVTSLNLQLRISEKVIAHLEDRIKELERQVNELLELHSDRFEVAAEKAFAAALAAALPPLRIVFLETLVAEFCRELQRQPVTQKPVSRVPKEDPAIEQAVVETMQRAVLSKCERAFLQILIDAKGAVVEQSGLFQRFGPKDKIHKLLCRCRKKLRRANPDSEQWIHTHYKLGYSFRTK